MATQGWAESADLAGLAIAPQEYNFYQAVRLLKSGRLNPSSELNLRFKGNNCFEMRPNFIESIDVEDLEEENGKGLTTATITVNGFHLTGQQGPLPETVCDLLFRAAQEGDLGPSAFLDIFNNGILHQLFNIKTQFNGMLFGDMSSYSAPVDLTDAVAGIPDSWLGSDNFPTRYGKFWREFVGLFANRRVSLTLFKQVLGAVLGCRVRITPMTGAWKQLPSGSQIALNRTFRLGLEGAIGRNLWSPSHAITCELEIEDLERFKALLPEGEEHIDFQRLIWLLSDRCFNVKVVLNLDNEAIPPLALNRTEGLGRTSWFKVTGDDTTTIDKKSFWVLSAPVSVAEVA